MRRALRAARNGGASLVPSDGGCGDDRIALAASRK